MHKLAQALLVTSLITGNAAWAAPHRECLATLLIRNFNEAPLERLVREPLYDALSARLAPGTAAEKLGISVDTVAPGKRSCPYHNTSEKPMKYLSVSTRESPDVCEYPDSGKYFAMARGTDGRGFEVIQRATGRLDYWDGEP